MWHNTRLLNLIANVFLVGAVLLAAQYLVIAALVSSALPMRKVVVTGELSHVMGEQISDALNGRLLGNFFAADLNTVRDWVQEVPWVRRASVRRSWPDTLEIRVEEHQALAQWAAQHAKPGQLVNTLGELFAIDVEEAKRFAPTLPRFVGPAETEGELTRRYQRFRVIVAPLANPIAALALSSRFAWEVRLADGLTIELGRDASTDLVEFRLTRFVSVYPETLAKLSRRLNYVDLRYPNGFALRVPDIRELELEREREDRLKKPT